MCQEKLGFSRPQRVHTGVSTNNQEKAMSIHHPIKLGDKVAYYVQRLTSTGTAQLRRVGIVNGWHDGKVIVLHKAGYTKMVADADLYLVE